MTKENEKLNSASDTKSAEESVIADANPQTEVSGNASPEVKAPKKAAESVKASDGEGNKQIKDNTLKDNKSETKATVDAVQQAGKTGRAADSASHRTGKRNPTGTVARILNDAVHKNGTAYNTRLKQHLTGRIQLIIDGAGSYILDWSGEELQLSEGQDNTADCTIEMSASDFIDVAGGVLNSQIAILSDKVKFSGQAEMASYLFNIFR